MSRGHRLVHRLAHRLVHRLAHRLGHRLGLTRTQRTDCSGRPRGSCVWGGFVPAPRSWAARALLQLGTARLVRRVRDVASPTATPPPHNADTIADAIAAACRYIAIPDCFWGSGEFGLEAPPDLQDVPLHMVKVSNATYGHYGEMAGGQPWVLSSS